MAYSRGGAHRFVLCAVAAAAIAGCGPRARDVEVPAPGPPPIADEIARLTIPPGDASEATLARLATRADGGDLEAAWARAAYLLDLFDDARFRRAGDDDAGARILARVTGLPEGAPARGREATDHVIDRLIVETDRVLAGDRLHAGAQAARTLLELDHEPPTRRDQLLQRVLELKRIARGGGAVADNARLRLFGICSRAFGDAVAAPEANRIRMLSFCLYPLFDSDPDPYFATDPAARPPAPRWEHLRDAAVALVEPTATSGRRLAVTARAAAAQLQQLTADRADRLPDVHSPAALGVPLVDRATPYDWTPLLTLGDGSRRIAREDYVARLSLEVAADERRAVAVSIASAARADLLLWAAGIAVDAGAHTLEAVVGYPQRLTVPAGDYWKGRIDGDVISRLGAIPLALAPMSPKRSAGDTASGASPRAMGWDAGHAALELHLVVASDSWRLVSPTGELARLDAADAAGPLRDALARVRAAFPDEDGLILVVEPTATYAAAIAALSAAATDADGHPLFGRFALATGAPAIARDRLGQRIERRWRARVVIDPVEHAARAPIVRACYQDLLERSPALAGTVRLELRGDKVAVVSGPANAKLRACVTAALAAPMREAGTASATATLSPR